MELTTDDSPPRSRYSRSYNLVLWMAIGTGIGAIVGAAISEMSMGISIGVAFGLGLGVLISRNRIKT